MHENEWLDPNNEFGKGILEKKYLYGDETFDAWLSRISNLDNELKELILDKKFLFGGRILANRGLQNLGKKITYSNCYVGEPPEDNIESIYECAGKIARTFSYGGGIGIDISKLAPRGARVNNSSEASSGAVSFMQVYSDTTEQIGQNGRRGALMISISVDHPDLIEFIEKKTDLDAITKANISVRLTKQFMTEVKKDINHIMRFTRSETEQEIIKKEKAKDIFRRFAEVNWDYAEPGALFWDRIEEWNLLSNTKEFSYAGTNPCGEEPLPSGGSCLIGSLNMSSFVVDGVFDIKEYSRVIAVAVRALNNVLDEGMDLHPLQIQRDSVRDWRQIGLGVCGVADMLIKLKIKYGSKEAIDICDKLASILINETIKESAELAKKYGAFPKCCKKEIIETKFFKENIKDKDIIELVSKYGLRNSQLLTIAPTGSISNVLGVSGAMEPIYALSYDRMTESLHGEEYHYKIYTPIVKEYMEANGLTDESQLPDYFVSSSDISYMDRINMQAAWQKHIDASISSTINLPNNITVDEVESLYMYAYEKKLKGLTIFRDGCKRAPVLTSEKKNSKPEYITQEFGKIKPITRSTLGDRLEGATYLKQVACGKLYFTINHDSNGNLMEMFVHTGKSGGCSANAECLGRCISTMLRAGVDTETAIDATKGVKCSACMQIKGSKSKVLDGISCGDTMAKVIEEEAAIIKNITNSDHLPMVKIITEKEVLSVDDKIDRYICPDCGAKLDMTAGCIKCQLCGWSKCD